MIQPTQIPSTGRKTAFQLKQLGFSSLDEFAASLPKKAVIADVGAGLSRFGHEVARLRPDITWVNIDPCYTDKGLLADVTTGLPANVSLFSGNIVDGFKPPVKIRSGADIVYSYWLLPHLSLENEKAARAACGHMYDLLKPEGRLLIGPVRTFGLGLLSPFRYIGTVSHSKKEARSKVVGDVVSKTKLWWLPRKIQLLSNKHNIHWGMRFIGGKTKH